MNNNNWFENYNNRKVAEELNESVEKYDFATLPEINNINLVEEFKSPYRKQYKLWKYDDGIALVLRVSLNGINMVTPVEVISIPDTTSIYPCERIYRCVPIDENNMGKFVTLMIFYRNQLVTTAYMNVSDILGRIPVYNPIAQYKLNDNKETGMTGIITFMMDGYRYVTQRPSYPPIVLPKYESVSTKNLSADNVILMNEIVNFINIHNIVAIENDAVVYFKRNDHRYVPIKCKDLEKDFVAYLKTSPFNELWTTDTSRKTCIETMEKFIRNAIQSSDNRVYMPNKRALKNHQIMFNNGYYDLKKDKFEELTNDEQCNFFNLFSIDMTYDGNATNTKHFDYLLRDMLDDDTNANTTENTSSYTIDEKIHFAYQIIGALITPLALKKGIFLFQGVSNGEKTRLSKIILSLLPKHDVKSLEGFSKIEDVDQCSISNPIRLVYFKEASDKQMTEERFVKIKSLSPDDGEQDISELPLKFLVNTNHKLVSTKNGEATKSLTNRIVVLPFAKEMTNEVIGENGERQRNEFENTPDDTSTRKISYFEEEKIAIVVKALKAFSEVVRKGNRFYCDFPINMYVEDNDVKEQTPLSAEERENNIRAALSKIANPKTENGREIAQSILMDVFEPTSEHDNPQMTAANIISIMNAMQNNLYKDPPDGSPQLGRDISATFGKTVEYKSCKGNSKAGRVYNLKLKEKYKNKYNM